MINFIQDFRINSLHSRLLRTTCCNNFESVNVLIFSVFCWTFKRWKSISRTRLYKQFDIKSNYKELVIFNQKIFHPNQAPHWKRTWPRTLYISFHAIVAKNTKTRSDKLRVVEYWKAVGQGDILKSSLADRV